MVARILSWGLVAVVLVLAVPAAGSAALAAGGRAEELGWRPYRKGDAAKQAARQAARASRRAEVRELRERVTELERDVATIKGGGSGQAAPYGESCEQARIRMRWSTMPCGTHDEPRAARQAAGPEERAPSGEVRAAAGPYGDSCAAARERMRWSTMPCGDHPR